MRRIANRTAWVFVTLAACAAVSGATEGKRSYDLVLRDGRVIDPQTGLDGIRKVYQGPLDA